MKLFTALVVGLAVGASIAVLVTARHDVDETAEPGVGGTPSGPSSSRIANVGLPQPGTMGAQHG